MIDSLFKRAIAYLIDIMLVSIVVNCLVSSAVVNFQLESYQDVYKEYSDFHKLYVEQDNNDIKTCEDLEKAFSDKKITEEKYVDSYEELKGAIDNEEVTEEEYSSRCLAIVDEYNDNKISQDEYLDKVSIYSYNLEKNSSFSYLINILVCLLYFVLFQGFTNGQTLGKKIMRLKIVSVDDEDKISYKKLLIRTIFLYSIIFYSAISVLSMVLSQTIFITAYNILYMLNYLLSLVLVFMIGVNGERRGLHDVISRTKVIEMDFKGNEIKREGNGFFSGRKKREAKENDDPKKEEKKSKRNNSVNDIRKK